MSRTLLTMLAAGLCLAACHRSPEKAAIADNAAALQASLEREAANMEAMADNASDPTVAAGLENAADRLEQDKHALGRAAKAAKREVR